MGFRQEIVCGVNLGGWMSQCALEPGHFKSFVTEDDFRRLAQWGFNAVRVPFHHALVESKDLSLSADGLKWLTRAVEMGLAYKLKVVLDLHKAPGHSFVKLDDNTLFTDPQQRKRVGALWAGLSRHFKKFGDDVWFELLNEACAPNASQWQDLAEYLSKAIRSEDGRRILVVGANMWSMTRSFKEMKPTGDERSIYTFHFYEPISFTHQGAPWVEWAKAMGLPVPYPGEARDLEELARRFPRAAAQLQSLQGTWDQARLEEEMQPVFDFAQRYDAQVFCGEFGVYGKAPRPGQLAWMAEVLDLFAKHQVGFFYWNYKNMDFGLVTDVRDAFAQAPAYANPEHLDKDLLGLLQGCARRLAGRA